MREINGRTRDEYIENHAHPHYHTAGAWEGLPAQRFAGKPEDCPICKGDEQGARYEPRFLRDTSTEERLQGNGTCPACWLPRSVCECHDRCGKCGARLDVEQNTCTNGCRGNDGHCVNCDEVLPDEGEGGTCGPCLIESGT